ncbi:Oidioi.mRNA.OKI2018_I69.YSR.g17188.t1.cds [Oikopleura dioica]|uniref:Oidioi.mRNA.OKI2018_I69.YSR.g17188.t1.cds n=1 Tax=Oikopleura dioica TaxID=34765 RepID=A0ABN7SN07_OIKDI|nr:Oidioi.mRNA.OKI2018_I69.YSR.g17188.t1.cds [Oikopleura dioica]
MQDPQLGNPGFLLATLNEQAATIWPWPKIGRDDFAEHKCALLLAIGFKLSSVTPPYAKIAEILESKEVKQSLGHERQLRPPSLHQVHMVGSYIENCLYRTAVDRAANRIVQKNSQKNYPRLQTEYRRIATAMMFGFCPKTEEERVENVLRMANYYLPASLYEEMGHENVLGIFSHPSPYDTKIDTEEVHNNADLSYALKTIEASLPSVFKKNSNHFSSQEAILLFLEGNALVPFTEKIAVAYMFGSNRIDADNCRWQCWFSYPWEDLKRLKTPQGRYAKELIRQTIEKKKKITAKETEEAIEKAQQDGQTQIEALKKAYVRFHREFLDGDEAYKIYDHNALHMADNHDDEDNDDDANDDTDDDAKNDDTSEASDLTENESD